MIPIYIPSAGRATRQKTLAQFSPKMRKRITLVVPKGEYKEYRRVHNRVEVGPPGIGPTRQFIIDECGTDTVLMMDDDMLFYHRDKPYSKTLINNTPRDNRRMIEWVEEYLDKGYAHVGVGARPEAHFHLCDFRSCVRINNFHAFDVGKFIMSGASFTRVKLMEDFDAALTLLEAGYRNAQLIENVWNQEGSNVTGGCSSYRTAELQAKSAHKLARLHPEVVKVVKLKVRGATSWEGMKERVDVRVQWKKAYTGKPLKHWKIESESENVRWMKAHGKT